MVEKSNGLAGAPALRAAVAAGCRRCPSAAAAAGEGCSSALTVVLSSGGAAAAGEGCSSALTTLVFSSSAQTIHKQA